MAAAAINHLRDFPHKLRKHESHDEATHQHPNNAHHESHHEHHQHEEEKKQILNWEREKHTLRPDEIVKRGAEKHVGFSSERLRCDDFDLLKTLGTGL
jgi:protein kinase A